MDKGIPAVCPYSANCVTENESRMMVADVSASDAKSPDDEDGVVCSKHGHDDADDL